MYCSGGVLEVIIVTSCYSISMKVDVPYEVAFFLVIFRFQYYRIHWDYALNGSLSLLYMHENLDILLAQWLLDVILCNVHYCPN